MSLLKVLLLSILLLSVGCGGKSASSKKDTPTNQEKPGGGDNESEDEDSEDDEDEDENKDNDNSQTPCDANDPHCKSDDDNSNDNNGGGNNGGDTGGDDDKDDDKDDEDKPAPPAPHLQHFKAMARAMGKEVKGINFGTKTDTKWGKPDWVHYYKSWQKNSDNWYMRVKIDVPGQGMTALLMWCHYHGNKMACHVSTDSTKDELGDEPFDDQYPEDKPIDEDECDIEDDDCIPD